MVFDRPATEPHKPHPGGGLAPENGRPARRSLAEELRSGDKYASGLTTSGMGKTQTELEQVPSGTRTSKPSVPSTTIHYIFKSCEEAAARAVQDTDDLIDKTNAINDLRDALSRLWDARESREEQFGDLVNHLQGLLLGVEPEELPVQHLEAVARVIRQAAVVPKLTDADLRDFERVLIKAGCDVFRELE